MENDLSDCFGRVIVDTPVQRGLRHVKDGSTLAGIPSHLALIVEECALHPKRNGISKLTLKVVDAHCINPSKHARKER